MTNLIVALKFTRSKLRGVILSQGKGRDFILYVKIFALFFYHSIVIFAPSASKWASADARVSVSDSSHSLTREPLTLRLLCRLAAA